MSRIGRKPIAIPAGVDFKFADGVATVKGPERHPDPESPSQHGRHGRGERGPRDPSGR